MLKKNSPAVGKRQRFSHAEDGRVADSPELADVSSTEKSMGAVFYQVNAPPVAEGPKLLKLLFEAEEVGHQECLDARVHPALDVIQISLELPGNAIASDLQPQALQRFDLVAAVVTGAEDDTAEPELQGSKRLIHRDRAGKGELHSGLVQRERARGDRCPPSEGGVHRQDGLITNQL